MPLLPDAITLGASTFEVYIPSCIGATCTSKKDRNTIYWMLYPVKWYKQGWQDRRHRLMDRWIDKNTHLEMSRSGDILYSKALNSFWVGRYVYGDDHGRHTGVGVHTLRNRIRTVDPAILPQLQEFLVPPDPAELAKAATVSPVERLLRERLEQVTAERTRVQQTLGTALRQFEAHQDRILDDVGEDEVEHQLRLIHALPEVVRVGTDGRNLIVDTDHIYIRSGGTDYHIGQCRLSLPIQTGRGNLPVGAVRVSNLTHSANRRPRGHHHPHVHTAGEPCLGEIRGTMTTFQQNFMLLEMVQAMLVYLKSVNVRDTYGATITGWPTTAGLNVVEDTLVIREKPKPEVKQPASWYSDALGYFRWDR